ncbi:DUF2804 domain-containing protein [Psychrobacter sp. I-STPA10]|uniref:DUF2804 domain-containing protein n=1 Tax=Psychrobacter sp. I-STPA10 TaxID=2585769 RepID=UPI001E2F83AD|nr:DUF2804 domain-containing protein [Psychrobacter sp. I-STPA10]
MITQPSNSPDRLPSIDRLIIEGQPQFGVFKRVETINYLDYHSHLISQKPTRQWQKKLKANQFCFLQFSQLPYRICVAVATIKLATTAFCYIFNEDSQAFECVEGLQPLTRHSQFTQSPYQGDIVFQYSSLSVEIQFLAQIIKVKINSKLIHLQANLQRHSSPLAVCSPAGRYGWTFTQKEPLQLQSGKLIINSNKVKNSLQTLDLTTDTLVNMDWTLGYMRHITNWFWTSINCYLPNDKREKEDEYKESKKPRHFALNLAMGVNETGICENACWLDGKIYYLPPVLFSRPNNSVDTTWHIYHQNLGWSNVRLDLTFTPIRAYEKKDNFGVIASVFEQWLGLYSGEIEVAGQCIVLDKVLGLAEDHFAKW